MVLIMWISIALLAGSLITAQHDNEEACLGRLAMLNKEKSVTAAQCVKLQSGAFISGNVISTPLGTGYCQNQDGIFSLCRR